MDKQAANRRIITRLMFRLLPIQVLLAVVGAVNGMVSSFFAANYVGINAMSAVGLYAPINLLITAFNTVLLGGSVILCGKYMGENHKEKVQSIFSLNLAVSALLAGILAAAFLILGLLDLTGFLTQDQAVRPVFNQYLLGQAIGVIPFVLGSQLPAFLSMENQGKRTMRASAIFILINLLFNVLFVQVLPLGAFGLSLASSLGMWVFWVIEVGYFLSGKAYLRLTVRQLQWQSCGEILRIGYPGAISTGYQTIRGLLVNKLLQLYVGSVGVSAFAAANNLMGIFWSVPAGMLAVSRLLISVSIGEEDRQTLTDVMRVMFRRFVPLMCGISALVIAFADPLAHIFFHNPAEPVYRMTAWGIRILPLCMPLSVICMHFVCYGQASGKQGLVHTLSLLDGVVCVAGFTALLIRSLGMNSVYVANVLNGVVTTLVIVGYGWMQQRRLPRSMDELMAIPEAFGAPEDARMDLTVRNMEGVVTISQRVQDFCLSKGVDKRRAYLAGLAMEEMAGNIVDHGFTKDQKTHSIDVRVVYKDDDVIVRIKDDCVPFDPGERQKMEDREDATKNIGIRMVFKTAKKVQYQNILGLNVLTIRI